jgi:hypothetical protein
MGEKREKEEKGEKAISDCDQKNLAETPPKKSDQKNIAETEVFLPKTINNLAKSDLANTKKNLAETEKNSATTDKNWPRLYYNESESL